MEYDGYSARILELGVLRQQKCLYLGIAADGGKILKACHMFE